MASAQQDIERFGAYLRRRNYAAHTIESYTLDLRLFFVDKDGPPATVTHRDVEQFVTQQHDQGLSPTTLNRRLYALKHFFDFLLEHQQVFGNPVKPSYFARVGRPLPRALSPEQVQALFAQFTHPMDQALFGGTPQDPTAGLRLVPDAVELCHVGCPTPGQTRLAGIHMDRTTLAP